MYLQVNIGRNYQSTAAGTTATYSERVWSEFQAATMDAIMDAIQEALPEPEWPDFLNAGNEYAAFEVHTGTGEWDGVEEESAHISVHFDAAPAFPIQRVSAHLHTGLEVLAKMWHQEAIAFLVTDSVLAMAPGKGE